MMKNPKPASTLCLMRNLDSESCAGGFEVFLMRRRKGGTFSGLHVFPGGVVDESDDLLEDDVSNSVLCGFKDDKRFLPPRTTQAYWLASIRETFEESGILLAYDKDEQFLAGSNDAYSKERSLINAKQLSFNQFLFEQNLRPAFDRITYMTRRITPKFAPARFDTHFFLSVVPSNTQGTPCDQELEDCFWITPAQALERADDDVTMIFPTLKALNALLEFDSAEQAFAHFQRHWSV